jgi:hypothetical protein
MITNFVYNQNSKYLFQRAYAVSFAAPGQAAAVQYGTLGNNPAPLRVSFDIDKVGVGTKSNAKIEVYNMSQQTRQNVMKSGWGILLQAGYSNFLGNIFYGDIVNQGTKVKRAGPDIIAEIHCGDGEAAIVMSTLDKTYPPGTALYVVLQDIANAMHLQTSVSPTGINVGTILSIPNTIFQRGLTLHGQCKDHLDKLLGPAGLQWNIDSGVLNIKPVGAAKTTEVIEVNINTGMIGNPSKNDDFTTFVSLLNPKLVPGALVHITSEDPAIKDTYYTLTRSHFEGDSHDNKWQVSCECIEATNINVALPSAQGFDFSKAVTA